MRRKYGCISSYKFAEKVPEARQEPNNADGQKGPLSK
jgi:hypothetical protein